MTNLTEAELTSLGMILKRLDDWKENENKVACASASGPQGVDVDIPQSASVMFSGLPEGADGKVYTEMDIYATAAAFMLAQIASMFDEDQPCPAMSGRRLVRTTTHEKNTAASRAKMALRQGTDMHQEFPEVT